MNVDTKRVKSQTEPNMRLEPNYNVPRGPDK